MKIKFSQRVRYTVAIYVSHEDALRDELWAVEQLTGGRDAYVAWIRIVEPAGRRWRRIVVAPRGDVLHID